MKHFLKLAALLCALVCGGSAAEAATKYAYCASTPCTWDSTNTPNIWFTATGGTGSATTVPTSADAATFDAASCAGGTTCTFVVGATINATSNQIQQINFGTCTATTTGCILDFATNNPSITFLTGGMSGTGTGTRTIIGGNGTMTFTGAGQWDFTNPSGYTYTPTGNMNFVFSSTILTGLQAFQGGSKNYGGATLTVNGRANGTGFTYSGANTLGTVNFNGPLYVTAPVLVTNTITNLNMTGTLAAPVVFGFISANSSLSTWNVTNPPSLTYVALRAITFGTSVANCSPCWDLGANTMNGGSITAPTGGGAASGKIIGG